MLPASRTDGEDFAIPTFDLVPSDVEGFMEELWEFQAAFHDCFARSEPRAHFFDSMVGQLSTLERKSIEPMALHVEGSTIRGLQRFISAVRWDEEPQRRPPPAARCRSCGSSRRAATGSGMEKQRLKFLSPFCFNE